MSVWVRACGREDINPEDLIRFDHGRRTFAIYRSPEEHISARTGGAPVMTYISPMDL